MNIIATLLIYVKLYDIISTNILGENRNFTYETAEVESHVET